MEMTYNDSKSQFEEDLVVYNFFKLTEKPDFIGKILDIGANDGITLSNSYALIKLGWYADLVEPSPKAFKSIYIDKGKTTTPSFLAKLFNTKKCQAIEASNKQEGNIVSNSKEKETVASEEHPKIEKIAHIIQSLIPFGYLCNLIKNLPKDTVRASVDKRHQGEKTRALTNNIK